MPTNAPKVVVRPDLERIFPDFSTLTRSPQGVVEVEGGGVHLSVSANDTRGVVNRGNRVVQFNRSAVQVQSTAAALRLQGGGGLDRIL